MPLSNSVLNLVRFPYEARMDSRTNLGVNFMRNVFGAFQKEDVACTSERDTSFPLLSLETLALFRIPRVTYIPKSYGKMNLELIS